MSARRLFFSLHNTTLATGAFRCHDPGVLNRLVQNLFPFDQVTVESVSPSLPEPATRYEPTDEAMAAFERLEEWLRDMRDKPVNRVAEEVLFTLARALLEGKNAYWHDAEDRLESLLACPSLVGIRPEAESAFREAVGQLLDCLHERVTTKQR